MLAKELLQAGKLGGAGKIGMTVEMCEVAWGKPFDKYSTITSDQKVEIWSYGWKRSLYFVNGVLTEINN